ncbi:MBL fold metallo-hydrolase [Paraburkholderia sp. J8-2]|uniref:MBL fold metallo-hydrolase n=1 Tax=Paraburkholderia sp. J8-2 TaxID=2805440 RepID=UPI002AB7712E|nr:MBL fold metallo-hydrolase [Paraburkholderia sp. J8-2]
MTAQAACSQARDRSTLDAVRERRDAMNVTPVTRQTLAYPCGEPPVVGEAREIAAGVRWIRLALPFSPQHINIWALRDGAGWAVIDSGYPDDATRAAWTHLLGPPGPFAPGKVTRLIATHMHQDHIGMANWLAREHGVTLWMTQGEHEASLAVARESQGAVPDAHLAFYRRAGWSERALAQHAGRFPRREVAAMHALPAGYRRIAGGELLRIGNHEWRVVVGSGHSPEHACLHCPERGLFISGDQVLPRISSNVSVWPDAPDADPLGDWLDSLAHVAATVPGDVLVLPAHNEPFHGLHARLDELRDKRERALRRLRARLAEPRRAVDVFGVLFARSVEDDAALLRMATGESLAYLNHLRQRGEIECSTDAQGVAWYRRV